MIKTNYKKGMTLVEIIIAMTIFSIIAIVFLTTFTSSFLWIVGAGDKGEAYSIAQEDVENSVAKREGFSNSDLIITFDSKDYSIRGGLVESTQTVRQRSSRLKTFVPLIPTIIVNPVIRHEGDINTTLNVNGIETNFNNSTVIDIFDYTGKVSIASNINPTVTNKTELQFALPSNLVNAEYIIRVTTKISTKPDEIARAKYIVQQPKFVSIGGSEAYISADGKNWILKSLPITQTLNGIASNYNRYVAVGENGFILISREKETWTNGNIGSENLNGITWASAFNKFYVVGEDGGIYSSENGNSWTKISSQGNKLNRVVSTTFIDGENSSNVLTAVGKSTIGEIDYMFIVNSSDGISWSGQTHSEGELKGVVSGNNKIVAVGKNRILHSGNNTSWTVIDSGTDELNDITFVLNSFISVGNSGLIMKSSDGITWSKSTIGTGYNLYSITALGNEIVIVGNNGTDSLVLYSNDGNTWESTTLSGVILNSVSGK